MPLRQARYICMKRGTNWSHKHVSDLHVRHIFRATGYMESGLKDTSCKVSYKRKENKRG